MMMIQEKLYVNKSKRGRMKTEVVLRVGFRCNNVDELEVDDVDVTVGASQFFLETCAEFHAIAHRPVAPGARVMPCTMRCTAGNERADGPCTCNVEELG